MNAPAVEQHVETFDPPLYIYCMCYILYCSMTDHGIFCFYYYNTIELTYVWQMVLNYVILQQKNIYMCRGNVTYIICPLHTVLFNWKT